ncbi:MAG: hypothetical protein RIB84_00605 [Sneathiellaceae bacterium]
MALASMPRLTPATAVMPGGVRQRAAGALAKVMKVVLQGAGGGTDYNDGIDGGAGGCVEIEMPVYPGDLFTLQAPQGGATGVAAAGSGQGGGSARLFRGDSTSLADLIAIAAGGGGAGDTKIGGAGGQTPQSGAGTDAGNGGAGSDLQGGNGTGGSGVGGGKDKGWPDGGDGAGEFTVLSGGGGGGGGKPGGDGGGPSDNGSGGQGGTSWADPTVYTSVTYLDGAAATPHAARNALLSGYGAGGTASTDDGQDGRILIYIDTVLLATLDYSGAPVPFVVPV